jgi:hypothetical protein
VSAGGALWLGRYLVQELTTSLRTGVFGTMRARYRRASQPRQFWFHMVIGWLLVGLVALFLVLVAWRLLAGGGSS